MFILFLAKVAQERPLFLHSQAPDTDLLLLLLLSALYLQDKVRQSKNNREISAKCFSGVRAGD